VTLCITTLAVHLEQSLCFSDHYSLQYISLLNCTMLHMFRYHQIIRELEELHNTVT